MKRNDKFFKGKEILKIYTEYCKFWTSRFKYGEWLKVKPYQQGWVRYFVLRKDISNRSDAPWIQKALDLVNNVQRCRNKEFERYSSQKKKDIPIQQTLSNISEKEFDKLDDDRVKKYLERRTFYKKTYLGKSTPYYGYTLKHNYWAVFEIEPNVILERWIPDPVWESRKGELDLKMERHNLWPKIYKELGISSHNKDDWGMSPYLRSKYGEYTEDSGGGYNYDELEYVD